MGGCSSKPKTTEFEGAMDLQDDKPHNDPSIKSLDAEKKGLDAGLKSIDREQKGSSENCLKTLWVENERGNLRDVLLESEKQPIAGFSSENNAKNAEEKYAERETLGAQNKHFIAEGETRTPATAGREIGPEGEALKLQKEPIGAGGKTLELQKESIVSEKGTAEQEESHGEKEKKQSQTQEDKGDAGPGYGGGAKQGEEEESKEGEVVNYGAKTVVCKVDSATDDGTVVQVEEREGEIVKKALTGLPEEGTHHESPRDEELVVGKSPSIDTPTTIVPDCTVEEDQKQTQEADKAATMSNELQLEPESSAEPHAELTAAAIENTVVPDTPFEDDSLVRVLSTEASNTTSAESELNLEETSVEGQEPTYPVDVESSNTEALISQEPALTEVPKESMDAVQGQQMSSPIIICGASKLEGDVLSNSVQVKVPQDLEASEGPMINHEEHPAASQPSETTEVNATTENSSRPKFQSVHVAEGNEPARPISSKGISAQDITPPDIDEVLEKLASEFQRQESLCSSMP